jgi:hypothetical protein
MKVEIGTEAAHFLFWEYINGIFVAVCQMSCLQTYYCQKGLNPLILLLRAKEAKTERGGTVEDWGRDTWMGGGEEGEAGREEIG